MEEPWKDKVAKLERMSMEVFEVLLFEPMIKLVPFEEREVEQEEGGLVSPETMCDFPFALSEVFTFDSPNPIEFFDSSLVSACASSKKGGTKDSVLKDIWRRFMTYDIILRKSLEETKFTVKKAKHDSLTEIPKRNDIIKEKNAEIIRKENEIIKLEENIACLETNNHSSKELGAELESLKKKLLSVKNEKKACEEITSTLEKEIFEYLKTISDMQVEEKRIKRLLAEAELSLLKVENLFKKGERDAAMAEYESFKAKLKKQNPSSAPPNQV